MPCRHPGFALHRGFVDQTLRDGPNTLANWNTDTQQLELPAPQRTFSQPTFSPTITLPASGIQSIDAAIGDVDNDGDLESYSPSY